jgi:hypothetical protein
MVATIRPKDLPSTTTLAAGDKLVVDGATARSILVLPDFKTALTLAKADVGLGNVDNTSDLNKPISTATQTALNGKQPLNATLTALAGLTLTIGDLLVADGAASVARLADVGAGQALISGGVGAAPSYVGSWATHDVATTPTQWGSPRSGQLFGLLSEAADGFENTEVLEAGAVLVAQAISSGCFDLAGAQYMVEQLHQAMLRDITTNWQRVLEQRRAKRQ